MALSRLGDYIVQIDLRNNELNFGESDVMGISVNKTLIPTKADLANVSLNNYKVLKRGQFAYCVVTSRNGNRISVAYNDQRDCIISSINPVFQSKNEEELNSDFLMMFFHRAEFDRYTRFNSWGSARETFDWETMCDVEIDLPSIDIQRKYVAIYKAMQDNLAAYQAKLDDLKLICDAYIENLRRNMFCEKIGKYLIEITEKNGNCKLGLKAVRGIATSKNFINTKADIDNVCFSNYKIVKPNMFAYVADTSRRGDKISLAFNNCSDTYLVSIISTVFAVKTEYEKYLSPRFLSLYFLRDEFDRYARFNSWGSARETFGWQELCNVSISIPTIDEQESIAEIFDNFIKRKSIVEKLKKSINKICPILIRGALQDSTDQRSEN